MEKGTMIGFVLAFVGVFLGAILKGADPVALFVNIPAILIVWIGSIGAVLISHPFVETANVGKYFQKVVKGNAAYSAPDTIKQIVTLTTRARGEGLLALEEESKKIEDPFFKKGIELAVDGTDPDVLKKTMLSEISSMRERHKAGQTWFTNAGVYAPTFGILGAVFGLMATMAHLDDPAAIGHGISAAFVATFWGVFLANAVYLPFANKLKRLSGEEVNHKMLIVEGVMAIQAGVSPRVVEEMLMAHVSPAERESAQAAA
ncbi:MAG: MotA/TolQ/ExbB proton channel family protein [Actinomycetota bacterium]|nr:MotA/TolQ/ExbB proton channel family protein [Actinomycetota bacterium]